MYLTGKNMLVSVFLVTCTWTAKAEQIAVTKAEESFRFDYTYDQQLRGWLKFYPVPVKWEEAVLRCYYEGAILASPFNETACEILSSIMVDHGLSTATMFTGISNTYATSEYQSMEGVPISDMCLVWSVEPTFHGSNICIAMHANGTVTAVNCAEQHPFVCFRQKGVKELNKCGTVDPEYVFYPETGSCYKKYTKGLSWSEAFRRCAIDGAHLAIINSQAEAQILWNLTGSHNIGLIGIRAWGAKRDWITVQGQSLNEAGYTGWRAGEPNNSGGNEYCGCIYAGESLNGVMNDLNCNHNHNFFCEIEAKTGTEQ